MSLDAASGVDLVRRIVAGDDGAEGELIERCGPALRFLALRYARDEADAEDLYQETLILALEKIRGQQVRQPERLAGFLRALAKNLATQRYRQKRFAVERPAAELADPPDDLRPDPLVTFLRGERTRLTRRLLEELEMPRDRAVLFRYYLAEESSDSICADLGLKGNHFYRVLHRARQRFRRLWEAHAQAGPEHSQGTP